MAYDKWAKPQKMWDERFAQEEPVYGEHPNAYLRAQAHRLTPGCKVLVPGDGYGRDGMWLALYAGVVTGVRGAFASALRAYRWRSASSINSSN